MEFDMQVEPDIQARIRDPVLQGSGRVGQGMALGPGLKIKTKKNPSETEDNR